MAELETPQAARPQLTLDPFAEIAPAPAAAPAPAPAAAAPVQSPAAPDPAASLSEAERKMVDRKSVV